MYLKRVNYIVTGADADILDAVNMKNRTEFL